MVNDLDMENEELDMEKVKIKYEKSKGYEVEKWDAELYDVLGKKLEGSALVTLLDTPDMRGFEVWRRLRKDCNSTSPAMALKALVDIIVPAKVKQERELPKAIDAWSVKVTKVQRDHGEKLGSKMKTAIVNAMCPNSMIESIY